MLLLLARRDPIEVIAVVDRGLLLALMAARRVNNQALLASLAVTRAARSCWSGRWSLCSDDTTASDFLSDRRLGLLPLGTAGRLDGATIIAA